MKKAIFAALFICLLVALTGCACKHESTELRGVTQASCSVDGYTGDTYCLECDELVEKGSVVPARGHQLTDTMNYSDSTCYSEGYTGDIYCNFCGERVVTGEAIAKKEHTPSELRYVREADCWDEGYTGDIECEVCGYCIEEGEFTPALGHTPGDIINVTEPTCTEWGYTGDIPCTVCGSIIEYGDSIDRLPHTAGEPVDAYEATCTSGGYTGDIYCAVCGDWMDYGEYTDYAPHTPGELIGAMDATCASPGYTGDFTCAVCEKFVEGENTEKLEHTFEGDVCTACGWMTPGLYINDALAFTWDQLIQNGYVYVNEDNGLESVVKSLYGKMVIAEGVYLDARGIFQSCQLDSVWLPSSVTWVPNSTFADNTTLAEIKFFGRLDSMGEYVFANNTALEHFDIPAGITEINYHAFTDCTSLKSVTIPEGVTYIDRSAFANTALLEVTLPSTLKTLDNYSFSGCTKLTSLILPEGLETIGENIVQGSSVGSLVFPSTLNSMGAQKGTNLFVLDMSKSQITKLYSEAIGDNAQLKNITLPEKLEYLEDTAIYNCPAVEVLDIPDTVTSVSDVWWGGFEGNTGITTVIWPASLTDGTTLTALPNLSIIFYKGSELQWDLTASSDMFQGKTIIFDYVEPTVEIKEPALP